MRICPPLTFNCGAFRRLIHEYRSAATVSQPICRVIAWLSAVVTRYRAGFRCEDNFARTAIYWGFGVEIPFPIAEDSGLVIACAYGMIHPAATSSAAIRATYVIDPAGVIRAISWYSMTVGRSVAELLRMFYVLQATDAQGALTPENWQLGESLLLTPFRPLMPSVPEALQIGKRSGLTGLEAAVRGALGEGTRRPMNMSVVLLLVSFVLSLGGLFVFIASMTRGLFGTVEEGSLVIFSPDESNTREDPAASQAVHVRVRPEMSDEALAVRIRTDQSSARKTLLCFSFAVLWLIWGTLFGLTSSLAAGVVAGVSWTFTSSVTRLFVMGNVAWMTVTAGTLYQEIPQRLCNAYLWDDLLLTGRVLIIAPIVIVLAWLVKFIEWPIKSLGEAR